MYSWMAVDSLGGLVQIVCFLTTILAAFCTMVLAPR
jgi:hypothetical protein